MVIGLWMKMKMNIFHLINILISKTNRFFLIKMIYAYKVKKWRTKMETTKKIGEVFSDYKQESNVKNAQIKQMNLIRQLKNK